MVQDLSASTFRGVAYLLGKERLQTYAQKLRFSKQKRPPPPPEQNKNLDQLHLLKINFLSFLHKVTARLLWLRLS
jgi:hypothetical protein